MNITRIRKMILGTAAFLAAAQMAFSQPFAYSQNDLVLGFRKTGSHQANYEVVVDIGQGLNYLNLAAGTSTNVPNFTPAQLTTNTFPNLTFLNWSVLGFPNHLLSGYPNNTLWLTVPRANASVQSTAPGRLSFSAQQNISADIQSIFDGAVALSGQSSSNASYNNTVFVREPINDSENLTTFVGGLEDSTISTLQDTWPQNVEITTPSSFTSAVVSDFYELRPTGYSDPHTGSTTGDGYYVGYFTFNTNGTMTFTRATSYVAPPPMRLAFVRNGTTNTISFATTNGATYKLYYTNTSGIRQPTSTWPSPTATVTGNGATNSFTDVTSDTTRVYRVGAH